MPQKRNNTALWVILIVALGGGCLVLLLILAAVLFPVFSQARLTAQITEKLSTVKQLNAAYILYSADWDDAFPPDGDVTRVEPYLSVDTLTQGFSFNENLAGKKLTQLKDPGTTLLVYLGQSGQFDTFLDRRFVGYADGRARALRMTEPEPSLEVILLPK
jgi:hypothetical protein